MRWLLIFFSSAIWAADPYWHPDAPKALLLSGGLISPGLDFSVSGPGTDATFVPNSPALAFVGASYKRIGFSIQFPSAPDAKSTEEKGHSSIQDYQIRLFGHRDTHELIYQDFHGYMIQDWKNPTTGQNELRPDMQVQTLGYNYITVLSPNFFSNAVAYAQRGQQTSAGGSWMLWGSAGHTSIKSSTPMMPTYISSRSRIHELHSVRTHYLMGGVAYGYTIPIFSRFYAVGSVYGGGGFGIQKAEFENEIENWRTTNLYRIGLRLGSGYNHGNHATGLQIIIDQNTTKVADGQLAQATFSTRLFYTYRWQDVQLPLPQIFE